jgi:hypothetical protein
MSEGIQGKKWELEMTECHPFSHLPVTASVSAAVPAPQQYMFGAIKWIFSQFLSATIGPSVALVSAPRTTPS